LFLTVLGLSLGVISILVAIFIAIKQRRPKRVIYDITANRRIVTGTDYKVTKGLVVTYGDRRLSDPYLVVVRIANGGKVEIRPEDWEESLSLKTHSEVVDSGVVGTSSKDMSVELTRVEAHQVTIGEVLLNQGEWFDVQMLVDGPGGVSDASARIAGARLEPGKSIKPTQPKAYILWSRHPMALVLIASVVAGVAVVVAVPFMINHLANQDRLPIFPTTRVPLLIGKSASQVVPDLHSAHLHLGNETFIPSLEPTGTVVDQYPGAGSQEEVGERVSIVVAKRS
jgi:PASTA domain